jgi:DNA-binding response OmpR family regulator
MNRILIIEDNEDLRESIRQEFEAEGFEVGVAPNGEEGVEMQHQTPADVVVTDLYMPGKEGLETIITLRKEYPRVKIIAISGGSSLRGRQDYLQVALDIGADRALHKPFAPERLLQAVRELLA